MKLMVEVALIGLTGVRVTGAQDQGQELEDLKKRVAELERKLGQEAPSEGLPKKAQEEVRRKAGGIYGKPFLARFGQNAYLGGYADVIYRNPQHSNDDTFDLNRFVPFIYADVSDRVKLASEIEIEHGRDVFIEFATIDYWIREEFNVRAGYILLPVGKFNLEHDAPFQDLTDRPRVDDLVIPAVLREPGAGFFGSYDCDPAKVDYEFYVTNGFKGLTKTGSRSIDTTNGLRNARVSSSNAPGSVGRDFNDNKALVGRLGLSPFLGLDGGFSSYHAAYDERGENDLTIYAIDGKIALGGVHEKLFGGRRGLFRDMCYATELVGEWAYVDIDRNTRARLAGISNDFRGYYLEGRYHFMPAWFKNLMGSTATDESTFTLVVRWDDTDLAHNRRDRLTTGINFRLRENTVLKFEAQWNYEGGDLEDVVDNAFVVSVATYF